MTNSHSPNAKCANSHTQAPQVSNDRSGSRRSFFARLAALSTALGLGTPMTLEAMGANLDPTGGQSGQKSDPWTRRLSGRTRVVFHSHMPTDGLAIRWAEIFLNTQKAEYGLSDKDCSVVVGLNGKSIGWLFNDNMWRKYPSVGAAMGTNTATNPMTSMVASLIPRGVIVLACRNSLGLSGSRFLPEPQRSNASAQAAFGDEAVKNLLPGVEVVPSMVVTLQQAQDLGCRYVYAGS